MQETQVRSLGWEHPPEEEMATHASILAWEIPQTEKPGGLQSIGLQSRTRLSTHTHQRCMCVNSSLPIHSILLPLLGVRMFILYVCVLQKPVLEKPSTRELENSALLHWRAHRS